MAKYLKSRVAKLEADNKHSDAALLVLEKEVAWLKKDKEYSVAAIAERLKTEVAELKRRDNRSKKLVVNQFRPPKNIRRL